jgi:hypothetical protein
MNNGLGSWSAETRDEPFLLQGPVKVKDVDYGSSAHRAFSIASMAAAGSGRFRRAGDRASVAQS